MLIFSPQGPRAACSFNKPCQQRVQPGQAREWTQSRQLGRLPHLPTTMGFFQPGTTRGMLRTTMGSRNTVPFRMFLMVPLGLSHIFFKPNSFTRASSGVMVAHLMPTPTLCRHHH